MDEDRGWTLVKLEQASGIEKRTVHRILCNELHLHKITARWVPHALMVQRWLCYAICSDHFTRCLRNGNQFLSRIIIKDFWARTYGPEMKRQSVEWRHSGLSRRQKCPSESFLSQTDGPRHV
ncbi:histone-lysine N-methyltransferase SETMAR [Trichonephila clavata]|uniref:Histone-lysine N-methyltransferase SETMAR n=1 Tax=Trichonephila clavata TaxID=2740835 RepID=A0A8X6KSR2_TRICU|nr:histone-lysine N-methyltransferase SETMAR [Trichonephila clavata]